MMFLLTLGLLGLVATAQGYFGGAIDSGTSCSAGVPGGGFSPGPHGAVVSNADAGFGLSFSPALMAGDTFTPNTEYTVTVTGGSMYGILVRATAGTVAADSSTLKNGPCASNTAVTHTGRINSDAVVFRWTTPSVDADLRVSVVFNHGSGKRSTIFTESFTADDSVDCSSAPDCASLNRAACESGTTANTCGACIATFYDPVSTGSSNSDNCAACNAACATCSDPSTQCLTCANGFAKNPGPACSELNPTYASSSSVSDADVQFQYGFEVDRINFRVSAPTSGWVAVGLSPDKEMPTSWMFMARVVNGVVQPSDLVATGYGAPGPAATTESFNAQGTLVNGVTTYEFSVPTTASQTVNGQTIDLSVGAGQSHYIFVAHGSGAGFSRHALCGQDGAPLISTQPINLFGTASVSFRECNNASPETIAHGIFMIFAWVMMAPIGTMLARYFKAGLPAAWFPAHRALQVGAGLLTLISFVLIIIAIDFETMTHQLLGVVVVILTVIQILLGACRNQISGFDPKNPKSAHDHGPRRWIFNILHQNLGRIVMILAVVTVLYGIDIIGADVEAAYVVYAFIAVYVIVSIVLEIIKYKDSANGEAISKHLLAFASCFGLAAAVVSAIVVANTPTD